MEQEKNKLPLTEEEAGEDLGIKVGTKDEVLWTELKKKTETYIESIEKEIKVQKAILELANQKIDIEQNI